MYSQKFLIQFFINQEKAASKRQDHLVYIELNKVKIVYGGVIENNLNKFGVLYIVKAEEYEQALNFYKNDPYSEIAEAFEIFKFEQKLPKNL